MSGKKRRKISVQPQGGLNSDINITPMVDVVLVLLIIFMVVTPLLEKDIEVKVPDSEKVEQLDEVPQDQLVVTVAQSGELKINLDVMPTQQEYVDKLSRMLAAKKKGDKLVFFTADDQTNYAKLVAALDGARQAGAETLGMATDKIEAAAPAPLEAPPETPAP
ncbi:biopolymer transporter ExbD [Archangium sp.]|uniref:ExbD/TolR family protein n=1 Tax=Archangium sp. TaxID=1872627 RepID=UPI00286A6887|nr:biopolymer transporter ExbD [Archangium sp.]